MTYFVYILECRNGNFYTGYTNNLEKRYQEHCDGIGAKYTRSFKPQKITQNWSFPSKSLAMKAEAYIKSLSKKQKVQLIINPDWLTDSLYEKMNDAG